MTVSRSRASKSGARGVFIREPADVARWASGGLATLRHEEAWVLVLDAQHRLIRASRVGTGTADRTHVEPSHVVRVASAPGAAGFVLVHNHPSDAIMPGKTDVDTTAQVLRAARRRGARLLDSVIVGPTGHSSMRDCGVLPEA